MTPEILKQVYETAVKVVDSNDWHALDFVDDEQLAMFCVRVYEGFNERKVLTERMFGTQDLTVIVSWSRVSVILNETAQSSYVVFEVLFQYADIYADLSNLLQCVDFAIARAELN